VPLEDPAALAEAMARLADEPNLRRRMGAEGKRRIQDYSSGKMAEKIDAVYRELLRNRREKAKK
jgi:glycosyltransferase involved in cell wall biosynthesis